MGIKSEEFRKFSPLFRKTAKKHINQHRKRTEFVETLSFFVYTAQNSLLKFSTKILKTLENFDFYIYNIVKWGKVEQNVPKCLKMVNLEKRMELFCREYRYSLDAKNRIFIPAKYREVLGDDFVITRSIDPCLALYTKEDWDKYSEKIKALPDSVALALKRFIFPKTAKGDPDSQGRVIIPSDLKEYAQLEKNAVIIGVGDHAEIWSEALWNDHEKNQDIEGLRELMRQLGL